MGDIAYSKHKPHYHTCTQGHGNTCYSHITLLCTEIRSGLSMAWLSHVHNPLMFHLPPAWEWSLLRVPLRGLYPWDVVVGMAHCWAGGWTAVLTHPQLQLSVGTTCSSQLSSRQGAGPPEPGWPAALSLLMPRESPALCSGLSLPCMSRASVSTQAGKSSGRWWQAG